MPISIRIKRGVGGAPTTLLRGELAFDEDNQKLYIGKGDSGSDDANGLPIATSVVELTTPPTVLADLADISVGSGAADGDVLVYDSTNDEWVAQAITASSVAWDDVTSKPAAFPPDTHASSHHTGGGDAIAPADIGAAASNHTHSDATTSVAGFLSASDKTKLDGIASGAEVNVQSDWNASSGDAQILNKPSLATVATTGAYSDLSGTPMLGTAAASASTDFVAASSVSTFGGSLIDDADASAARTTLGLGGAAEKAADFYATASHTHAASDINSGTLDIARIPTGSTSSTVCIGDDARLSDNRDPNSHTHGNITNAGAIGSTSGLPVKTGTSGVLEAGAFGTGAGEFCEGDDSRLSDARTPTAHNHTVTLEISGFIEAPEAKTYVLSPSIPAAITITNLKAKTGSGTCDIKLQDDGVDISDTSINDVSTSVSSPASEPSATVASGSVLALVVSDLSSGAPEDLAFSVHYTVASANNA